jgi:2'-5' RNA ligase
VTQHRYAIYLAPAPETPLWRFGSDVLGYDAASGEQLSGFAPAGFTIEQWRDATARPRTYGFHGTLKAPFRLASGKSEGELMEALQIEAANHEAFDAGPLGVACFQQGASGFVALTQAKPCAELVALEAAIVPGLDHFRAALTPEEFAAREPEKLTHQQRANLARWGYPHAGPDFSFHMTLSGLLQEPCKIAAALGALYESQVGATNFVVDALVLFAQPAPGAPFRILLRAPLGASPSPNRMGETGMHASQGIAAAE